MLIWHRLWYQGQNVITKGSKYHTRGGTNIRTNKGSTQYHRSTRGVTTKWEDSPFTHETKVYHQGGETSLLPTRPRWGNNHTFIFLSQGILSTRVPYNNYKFLSSPYKEGPTRMMWSSGPPNCSRSASDIIKGWLVPWRDNLAHVGEEGITHHYLH